jgi:hypothetical protein
MVVMLEPDPTITCIDCGGHAHLLTTPQVDPEAAGAALWQPGDIVTYRCSRCLDRWDIVLADDDEIGTD